MDILFYDIECYKYDWTVTFKSLKSQKYYYFHNDNVGIRDFVNKNLKNLLCGWNSKMYDDYVLLGMINGLSNFELKQLNDWIIEKKRLPWEFPLLNGKWRNFKSFDLRDDMYRNLSLKVIEGNLKMDIEETSVPFDIDRPLTEEELKQNIEYNKADVDATERLFHARKNYLYSKVRLGRQVGLKGYESLRLTNGKLSARYLNAKPIKRNDERDFKYPDTLNKENIDDEILQFFNQMWDKSIPSDKLFKSKLKIRDEKNDMDIIYGFGGVHGATPNYIGESTEDRVLLLYDVSSLYPSLMIEYDLLSRNVPNPEEFEIIYKNRFKAKREGDKETSDDLKLVLS